MGWQPSYRVEARIYGRYILSNLPDAKIAVLYQNDDLGKDYFIGLREGLGDKADGMIVATKTYETTDPTVDSQIVALRGSGANVLVTVAAPKFAAQIIRKVYDIEWKPTHFLANISTSIKAVMQPAGPEKGIGIITAAYIKDPNDPQWRETPEYNEWQAWMIKYNTSANLADAFAVYGYSVSRSSIRTIKGSITIRRYLVVLTANASGTDQMGAVAKGQARPTRSARSSNETGPCGVGRLGVSRPAT